MRRPHCCAVVGGCLKTGSDLQHVCQHELRLWRKGCTGAARENGDIRVGSPAMHRTALLENQHGVVGMSGPGADLLGLQHVAPKAALRSPGRQLQVTEKSGLCAWRRSC